MKATLQQIERVTTFPCLMRYSLNGESPIGIFIVNKLEQTDKDGNNYSVIKLKDESHELTKNHIGVPYFKKDLNLYEWEHLPKGTSITIINQ